MKTVNSWNCLREFGIDALTAESCGIMLRILFDLDERGANVIRKCFGFPRDAKLGEAWNRGTAERPHVGSVMLSQDMLTTVGIFALLENGCTAVYLLNQTLIGIEPGDPADAAETMRRVYKVEFARCFSYGPTGDRNQHQMSGRIE